MTDPNQPKYFISKRNGKKYRHFKRHCANERQVCRDIFKDSFEKRLDRKMTKEEKQVFNTSFNMGYSEGKLRGTHKACETEKN